MYETRKRRVSWENGGIYGAQRQTGDKRGWMFLSRRHRSARTLFGAKSKALARDMAARARKLFLKNQTVSRVLSSRAIKHVLFCLCRSHLTIK